MERRKGRLGQIPVYLKTCFRVFINEQQWKKLIFALIISLIVAYVVGDDIFFLQADTKMGAFAIISACIWIGIFNSIQSICRERAIIKREHRTGMHISSYIIAHMIFEFCICFVQSIIMFLCVWLLHGDDIPEDGVLFPGNVELFITFLLVLFAADILAMAVSSLCHSESTAMTVMPFLLIVQLVFSGLLFELDDISFVRYLTLSNYGVCAMGTTSNMNYMPSEESAIRAKIRYDELYEEKGDDEAIHTDEVEDYIYEIAKDQPYNMEYDFVSSHLFGLWAALLLHTAVYAGVAIVALEFVDKDKR